MLDVYVSTSFTTGNLKPSNYHGFGYGKLEVVKSQGTAYDITLMLFLIDTSADA